MGLVSELVFYTLLILLPVNLGAHFSADFSYIHGVLVDYYIPTVYLTDLLVIFLLGTWVVEIVSRLKTGGFMQFVIARSLRRGNPKIDPSTEFTLRQPNVRGMTETVRLLLRRLADRRVKLSYDQRRKNRGIIN